MKKICYFTIILGFILTACSEEESVIDVLNDPPILSTQILTKK